MERTKRILDALRREITTVQRGSLHLVAFAPVFYPFEEECKESPGTLAHLHEAIGAIDLLQVSDAPEAQLDFLLEPLGELICAAHLHRIAGAPERAAAVANRVLVELRGLVDGDRLRTTRYYNRVRPPYVWEMIGDATVCTDPAGARAAFQTAKILFRKLDRLDQLSEGNEVFPGYYHDFQVRNLLQGGSSDLIMNADVRIRAKREQWLGD